MRLLSLAELLQAGAAALAAGRLIQLRMSGRQPALLVFLAFVALDLMVLGELDPATNAYFRAFVYGSIISWVVSVFAVRETFILTFRDYPGIQYAGKRAILIAVALSVLITVAITAYLNHGWNQGTRTHYFLLIADRTVVFTLAVVVLFVIRTMKHFPLKLPRSTYVSTAFFSAVFLSESAVTLIDSLSQRLFNNWIDTIQVAFAAICFVAWGFMLRFEPLQTVVRFDNRGDDDDVLGPLVAMDRLMSRLRRR